MNILFAIPHYYDPHGDGTHQSLHSDRQPRIDALAACLTSLHHLFGNDQYGLDIARRLTVPANAHLRHTIEVVVCTVGERHLLSQLPVSASAYRRRVCHCEPLLLGYECQQVLREALGRHDYYCYVEDDLVFHDPLFFTKLAWFTRVSGDNCVLQPNRFETPGRTLGHKLYVDGDLRPYVSEHLVAQRSLPELRHDVLGTSIVFRGALNPHSGGFFLNADQMRHWTEQPWFGDRDTSFIGPLESAATLGVLRTFRVYKSALENASFLELQHYGEGYLGYAGGELPFATPGRPDAG